MRRTQTQKNADRFLKNYRNFKKLADDPIGGAFTLLAVSILQEVDTILNHFDLNTYDILTNLYCLSSSSRKRKTKMISDLGITAKAYDDYLNSGLSRFASQYKSGVLEHHEMKQK